MRRKKRRGSSRFIFIFLLIILGLSLIYFGLKYFLSELDMFNLEHVAIKGNVNLEKQYLANFLKDEINKNIFEIDKEKIMLNYRNLTRIKDIKIKKVLPDKIQIEIKERKAIFLLKTKKGRLIPLDKEKIALSKQILYKSDILPIIDSELELDKDFYLGEIVENDFVDEIYKMRNQIEEYDKDFFVNISEVYRENNDLIFVENNIGYKIILGEQDYQAKISGYNFIRQLRNLQKEQTIILKWDDKLVLSKGD